jgi:hypothetical protein
MTPADFHAEELPQTLVEMAYSMIGNGLVSDKSPGKTVSKRAAAFGPASAVVGLAKVDGSGLFTLSSAAAPVTQVTAAGAGATA